MTDRKTNPDVHLICGKCGCATMMHYDIELEIDDDGKYIPIVYLHCKNCGTLTGLDEVIKDNSDYSKMEFNEKEDACNNVKPIERGMYEIYDGDVEVTYNQDQETKNKLLDSLIKWCEKWDVSSGEDAQCDNFNIYAPDFIANALDNILQTKNYCKDED